ncbi:MAG: calcium-binding protein [SAR202 cluster bacterium]|nr:calcium-binding protein [SAR202 cluster bacterium]
MSAREDVTEGAIGHAATRARFQARPRAGGGAHRGAGIRRHGAAHARRRRPRVHGGNAKSCAKLGLQGAKYESPSGAIHDAAATLTLQTVAQGTLISWTEQPGPDVTAITVKGGPKTNIYYFGPSATGGGGLHAPLNPKNGKFHGVSHVLVCSTPAAPAPTPTPTPPATLTPTPAPLLCDGLAPTIVGTEGADVIDGTSGNDVVFALGGDDIVKGWGGDDVICAGAGNDCIHGGAGNDTVYGQHGDDTIFGEDGHDTLSGGKGADHLDGGDGDYVLKGINENDTLVGGDGNDHLDGGEQDDALHGGDGADKLSGGNGAAGARRAAGLPLVKQGMARPVSRLARPAPRRYAYIV